MVDRKCFGCFCIVNDETTLSFHTDEINSNVTDIIFCLSCCVKKYLIYKCSYKGCNAISKTQYDRCCIDGCSSKWSGFCPKHMVSCNECNQKSCNNCFIKSCCLCGVHKCSSYGNGYDKSLTACELCSNPSHKLIKISIHMDGWYSEYCAPKIKKICCYCYNSCIHNKQITEHHRNYNIILSYSHRLNHKECICGEIICSDDLTYNISQCDYCSFLHSNNLDNQKKIYHKLTDLKIQNGCHICNESYITLCCDCVEFQKIENIKNLINIPTVLHPIIGEYMTNKKDHINIFNKCKKCLLNYCNHHSSFKEENVCENCIK